MTLTIARSLIVFGVAVSASLFASIGLQQTALQRLKVNGPIYEQVIYGKDLIADILPPPLFVVESYMLSFEASKFPELTDANLAKITNLKKAYDDRRAYWKTTRLPQTLKDELENDVISKGDVFWQVMDSQIIPALKAKDSDKAHGAIEQLRIAFHAHQDAVEKLVGNSDAFLKGQEANAASEIVSWTMYAGAAGLGATLLLFLGLYALRRRVIVPIDVMKAYMGNLAAGDYSQEVPYTDRSDEIGAMSKAVAVFRDNAMERQQMRLRDASAKEAELESERTRAAEKALEDEKRLEVMRLLTEGLEHLSQGDLSYRIATPFAENYEKLRVEFNSSLDALSGSMGAIAVTTTSVHTSSAEIATATENLAKRTEEQAATIEESAAAIEEITATVQNSSERAKEANAMMSLAQAGAERSADVVREAIDAMEKISGSSRQISQIINVIDEIAFQTNLLALNAGVEAARAGEAGKGFAVVAQEVRELASRSANAAKEIKALISASASQVSSGVALVNRTGDALSEIEGHVKKVTVLIGDIVTASAEQATAIAEISSSVNRMDQVTQQNAAMAEETNAACRALNDESNQLDQIVRRFRNGEPSTRSVVASRPVASKLQAVSASQHRPTPSPARALGNRLAGAFAAGPAAAPVGGEWEEF
jgi:methyl-accepting chemotaxis protein